MTARGRRLPLVVAGLALLAAGSVDIAWGGAAGAPSHGLAMHGQPALPADFSHFPYVNPDAPKGGTVTYAVPGSFDSVNPFIVQGASTSARGLRDPVFGNLVYESLMQRSADEPFTLYPLIAESVDLPEDRRSVTFTLDPRARFSDGRPVTVDDVVFSLEILRDKGRPNYRAYYRKVARTERVGERGLTFYFDGADRELPLIVGLMPILPKHAVDRATFDRSTLVPIPGSGPYVIAGVEPPSRVVLERDRSYWAASLPSRRGFANYDRIVFDYYRDNNTMFEAFKKGLYDIQIEGDPSAWTSAYDFPAVHDGRVLKAEFASGTPKAMAGFTFNTRRVVFSDLRVRRALSMLLDFEWINKNLFHGAYRRSASYFQDSDLSALGRPASDRERALLAPFPDAVSADVMDGTYSPTAADGTGGDRQVLRQALTLLQAAGYALKGNQLVHADRGQPLSFEFLTSSRDAERLALAYARTLQRIGITMTVRTVDSTEFQRRLQVFDFDMMQTSIGSSLSPGNEQIYRWNSQQADLEGSYNYAGAKNPAIDAMIDAMLAAETREDFVAAVRALDRVLISGAYAVPLFYLPRQWVAHWRHVRHPGATSLSGYQLETWWADPAEASRKP